MYPLIRFSLSVIFLLSQRRGQPNLGESILVTTSFKGEVRIEWLTYSLDSNLKLAISFLTWFEIRRCFFRQLKSLLRLLRYCHFPQCTAPLKTKKQSIKNWGVRIQRKKKFVSTVFFETKSVFPGAKGEWVSRSARDSPHLRIETRWEPHIAGAKQGRKAPA